MTSRARGHITRRPGRLLGKSECRGTNAFKRPSVYVYVYVYGMVLLELHDFHGLRSRRLFLTNYSFPRERKSDRVGVRHVVLNNRHVTYCLGALRYRRDCRRSAPQVQKCDNNNRYAREKRHRATCTTYYCAGRCGDDGVVPRWQNTTFTDSIDLETRTEHVCVFVQRSTSWNERTNVLLFQEHDAVCGQKNDTILYTVRYSQRF